MKRAAAAAVAALTLALAGRAAAQSSGGEIVDHVEFRELALADAMRLLAGETGLNVVPSVQAGKVSVSLYLSNVPALSVIEAVCKANDLWYRKDEASGIIRIMTVAEYQRDLVSFRDEKTEAFTLLYPNATDVGAAIRDLFGDRVRLAIGRDRMFDDIRDLEDRFERFDLVDERSQSLGIFGSGGTNVVGNNGTISSFNSFGGSRGSRFDNRNNQFQDFRATRDDEMAQTREYRDLTAEQLQEIDAETDAARRAEMLESLRKRETNIYVTVIRRNNMVVVRTSDDKTMEEIKKLVRRLDVPTPLVLLEVKVMAIELDDGFHSAFDFQFADGVNNSGGFTTGDILPPASDSITGDSARRGASLAPGGGGFDPTDFIFQYVGANFRARLQLLENKNRVTLLATPLLLTANNEVSRVFVGEERPIVRNIGAQTVVNDNVVTSVPDTTIEFRPVGTTLLVTPNINADRTVTLRLVQENSSIAPMAATIPVVTSTGDVQDQPVDVVQSRTVSGTVVAKDGVAIAVGGLSEEGVRDMREQVPILGELPILGFFFRRETTNRTRRELIIMLRPYVLSTPAETEGLSEQLLEELSIHPNAPSARGTLGTYGPDEVAVPDPPKTKMQSIFRFHSVDRETFE